MQQEPFLILELVWVVQNYDEYLEARVVSRPF